MRRGLAILIVFINIITCFGLTGCDKNQKSVEIAMYSDEKSETPVTFMQFYDWFHENEWKEDEFVDKIDWEAIGIYDDDRDSEEFYYKQFSYIKSLGVDAISWEYHPRLGVEPCYPSENAIAALERADLKIACFYDFEIAIKVRSNYELIATLNEDGFISPTIDTVDVMMEDLEGFYDRVPDELLAKDKEGRNVIFTYGYDFDDSTEDIEKWDSFATELIERTNEMVGGETAYYWTCKNSPFLEHLYQHYSDNFVPFQFVLDTPQSQFSHDCVTWNLGYDNLGVLERDNLQRVIRLDQRYVQEMGWLSKATDPAAIFIYGWNEPFEGSMAIPTEMWGDTKAQLVKAFIDRIKNGDDMSLKSTLIITDDFDNYYLGEMSDWHYAIEREMMLYSMRRFLPQADACISSMVTPEILDKYDCVVDISTIKDEETNSYLLEIIDDKQVMIFDPRGGYTNSDLINYFGKPKENISINNVVVLDETDTTTYVRDDIVDMGKLDNGTDVILKVRINNKKEPILMQNQDDIFVNIYNNDELVLKEAFGVFYNTEMNISIMYGEGYSSQRLEYDPITKKTTMNSLNKYSVNGHWEIPDNVNWFIMPEQVDERFYYFIFGIIES